MPTWVRGAVSGLPYGLNTEHIISVQPGNSIVRCRFGIKADGFWTNSGTATQSDVLASLANWTSFGLVTTVGNNTEPVPSPVTQRSDVAPPTQRWLYLASATMSIINISGTSSNWPVGFAYPWGNLSSEGQVLSTGMAPPNTLNLWLSIDTLNGPWATPTPGDEAWYSAWWSVLLKN